MANPVVGERAKVERIGHQFGFELEWATQSHSMRVQTAEHDSTTSKSGVSIVCMLRVPTGCYDLVLTGYSLFKFHIRI